MKEATFTMLILLALNSLASADTSDEAGMFYKNGNYSQALNLLRPLAEQGNVNAQLTLGVMYENGQGVTQNYHESLKWYRLVAEQGNVDAQLHLGLMYENAQKGSHFQVSPFMQYGLNNITRSGTPDIQMLHFGLLGRYYFKKLR